MPEGAVTVFKTAAINHSAIPPQGLTQCSTSTCGQCGVVQDLAETEICTWIVPTTPRMSRGRTAWDPLRDARRPRRRRRCRRWSTTASRWRRESSTAQGHVGPITAPGACERRLEW